MSNMSYCMFQNTASDLDDCYNCIDGDLSLDESRAKARLIKLCKLIIEATEIEENDET